MSLTVKEKEQLLEQLNELLENAWNERYARIFRRAIEIVKEQ